MKVTIEPIKQMIGARVLVGKENLCDPTVVDTVRAALEERGVLIFPKLGLSDEEQLAFTDALGERVNFTRRVPGSDATSEDVYQVTLNKRVNKEADYVLGTFFWHIDGLTMDMALPKATLLTARTLSVEGGATEFANLYAAYEQLPESEKQQLEGLRAVHTLEASIRPVYGQPSEERIERWRGMTTPMEYPIVWTHDSGRKSLIVGTHGEGIVGMPGAHGRALLMRLQQWAAQPDFVYRHEWQVGDLVLWDNLGLMHRVVPYTDQSRAMHRTTIASNEKPGRPAQEEVWRSLLEHVV